MRLKNIWAGQGCDSDICAFGDVIYTIKKMRALLEQARNNERYYGYDLFVTEDIAIHLKIVGKMMLTEYEIIKNVSWIHNFHIVKYSKHNFIRMTDGVNEIQTDRKISGVFGVD